MESYQEYGKDLWREITEDALYEVDEALGRGFTFEEIKIGLQQYRKHEGRKEESCLGATCNSAPCQCCDACKGTIHEHEDTCPKLIHECMRCAQPVVYEDSFCGSCA